MDKIMDKTMDKITNQITMLGTGNATVSQIYNTCFLLQTPSILMLVDAGGGNGILSQLKKAGVQISDIHHLFGKLYIGENPTPERNSYLILHLNFAMISAGLDNYKKGLDAHCNNKFNSFCNRYANLLPPGIKQEMNQKEDAVAQLGFLCDQCAEAGLKIYLFIDEYDHFTNQILAHKEHEKRYREQTQEIIGIVDAFGREILHQGSRGESLGHDILYDAGIVGKLPVVADEHAYLVVVDADVGFQHAIRNIVIVADIIVHKIEYHYRVVHGCLAVSFDGEAIVVIPWLHHFCQFIHAMAEWQHASVIGQHLAHFLLGESHHFVELR
jgi:hypothetical protein